MLVGTLYELLRCFEAANLLTRVCVDNAQGVRTFEAERIRLGKEQTLASPDLARVSNLQDFASNHSSC